MLIIQTTPNHCMISSHTKSNCLTIHGFNPLKPISQPMDCKWPENERCDGTKQANKRSIWGRPNQSVVAPYSYLYTVRYTTTTCRQQAYESIGAWSIYIHVPSYFGYRHSDKQQARPWNSDLWWASVAIAKICYRHSTTSKLLAILTDVEAWRLQVQQLRDEGPDALREVANLSCPGACDLAIVFLGHLLKSLWQIPEMR